MQGKKQRYMNTKIMAVIGAVVLGGLVVGCRIAGGSAKSYDRVEHWSLTPQGKPYLSQRTTRYDKNRIGVSGLLASDEASGLQYMRTNSLGASASTKVGKFSGKPDSNAIKSSGAAIGEAIGSAVKTMP